MEDIKIYKLGVPHYKLNDRVEFRFDKGDGEYGIYNGTVAVVDAYGTFGQNEMPSYDIMITESGAKCICKHIPESDIKAD